MAMTRKMPMLTRMTPASIDNVEPGDNQREQYCSIRLNDGYTNGDGSRAVPALSTELQEAEHRNIVY
jgi:hypothetical protein